MNEIENCPFCGGTPILKSNRDWHLLQGGHTEECFFDNDDEIMMVPADEDALQYLLKVWNTRANRLVLQDAAQERAALLDDIKPMLGAHGGNVYDGETGERVYRIIHSQLDGLRNALAAPSIDQNIVEQMAKNIESILGATICGEGIMRVDNMEAALFRLETIREIAEKLQEVLSPYRQSKESEK